MEYKIVRDTTKGIHSDQFEKMVNDLLKEGWMPHGGLTVVQSEKGDIFWTQALIRMPQAAGQGISTKKHLKKKKGNGIKS